MRFIMKKEEPLDLVDIKSFSRWNGTYKNFTKNCDGCEYYRRVDVVIYVDKQTTLPDFEEPEKIDTGDKEITEDRCYWGVAWKRLVEPEKLRKCQYVNSPSPRKKMLEGTF